MIIISIDKVNEYLKQGFSEREAIIEILNKINKHFVYDDFEYKKYIRTYHLYLIRDFKRGKKNDKV